jgi:catechol 2,3-dioxygenase-like lactoylglutathione lyase family enzyme
MSQHIACVTLLVDDYQKAIDYFVGTLGFTLAKDVAREGGDRWVEVIPSGGGTAVRLAMAATERQKAAMGAQAGGRVMLVLYTDDFHRDHAAYRHRGVTILEEPRNEPYGQVLVFMDAFGNRWDLIEPQKDPPSRPQG